MIRKSFAKGFRAAFEKFALNPPTQVDEFMAKVESGKNMPTDPATDAPNLPQDPAMAHGTPTGSLPIG